MRVWVDLTNSPHVLVLRPVVERLRDAGHHVEVTARDFAQTVGLAERHGLDATVIGRHRGAGRAAKAVGLGSRSLALVRWARGRRFDLAIGHGSNDVTVAAAALRIRCATMHDYEWATLQHQVNDRLADRVVVPDAIPVERLPRPARDPRRLRRFPGLKEEYYLADLVPDESAVRELGIDPARPFAVVRTPPAVALYHRHEASLFGAVLERLEGEQVVVLPRTPQQREELRGRPFVVPERPVDAPSLVAFADLVVSAGGTMNREAVALGTPVWSTFEGRLGGVDERLIADGRLHHLTDPAQLPPLAKRERVGHAARTRRDPALLVELLTG